MNGINIKNFKGDFKASTKRKYEEFKESLILLNINEEMYEIDEKNLLKMAT